MQAVCGTASCQHILGGVRRVPGITPSQLLRRSVASSQSISRRRCYSGGFRINSAATAPVKCLRMQRAAFAQAAADAYWAKSVDHKYDKNAIEEWKAQFENLHPYSPEDLLEWRTAFDTFDRDNDGYISQADLQKTPTFSLEKSKLLKQYDKDRNNLIDFGEFVEAMFNVDVKTFRDSFDGFDSVDIQLEFDRHAVTNPANGEKALFIDHIKEIMREYSFTCITQYDATVLFEKMDTNGDHVIDLSDFKNWLAKKA